MKSIIVLMVLMLMTSLVPAQELVTNEDVVVAGMTPDSPFYGFEIAFEQITEIFGENFKIAHAKERLAETKLMIAEGKLEESKIAIQNFEKVRNRLRNKERLKEHKALMDNLGQKVSAIASSGELTDSERLEIRNLIEQHKGKLEEESIEIIQQQRGLSESQANEQLEVERLRIQERVTERIKQKVALLGAEE